MRPVVVVGGTGFLGRSVMARLKEGGVACHSLSRGDGCDLHDARRLRDRLAELRPRAVIHCAAHVGSLHYVSRRAADVVRDNVLMTVNLYAAVREACGDALVVNPISNCSYPGDAAIQVESAWQDGPVHDSVLPFGSTRRMTHAIARAYDAQHGVKSANWILPNAYGPGDATDPERVHALNGILIRMIRAQKNGDAALEIWGTGKPVREWIYVDDAARILASSPDAGPQLDPVNVAQKRGWSIAEIATIAAEMLGYQGRLEFNPQYADGAPRKILDDRLFRSKRPDFEFTDLRDGIARTIEYYRSVL